jgi:glycosyltransferase involved in cell wall biosynthesis
LLISFIVPAYNEEVMIGATVRALQAAAGAMDVRYEVIVVDDASTDRTADIARASGAAVVRANLRQISAVRNAGARAARGDLLIFVDADTLVPEETLRQTLSVIESGAAGGGARVSMDAHGTSRWMKALANFMCWILFRLGYAGGCYVFARREAFDAVGGFDERYFASEEIHFRNALKRHGRFAMVPAAVISSGRKMRLFTAGQLLRQTLSFGVRGFSALRRRDGLELWYGGQRETSDLRPPLNGGSR